MSNIKVGFFCEDVDIENARVLKDFKGLTEEEKMFLEGDEWVDISHFLQRQKELELGIWKKKEELKDYIKEEVHKNNVDGIVDLDFRGLDEEVDKLIQGIIIDLKVAKSEVEEREGI